MTERIYTSGRAKFVTDRIYEVVTPIFDKEMGQRMRTARMRLFIDQTTLGEKFGVHQKTISSLERGVIKCPESPFNLTKMREVFGKEWTYVLLGTGSDEYPNRHVAKEFWKAKLRGKRKQ